MNTARKTAKKVANTIPKKTTKQAAARLPAEGEAWRQLCRDETDRLTALRFQLLESHPFWGYLLLQMKIVLQPDLPSFAATDCFRTIWFNPHLSEKLSIRQLGFILVHEICHSVFASMERQGVRNPHLWNCATDFAINRIIMEIKQPGGWHAKQLYEIPSIVIDGEERRVLYDREYDGMIAETIYEKLAAEELENPTTLILKLRLPGGGEQSSGDNGMEDNAGEDNDSENKGSGNKGSGNDDSREQGSGEQGGGNSSGDGGKKPDEGGNHIEIPNVMDHHGGIDVHIPVNLSPEQREELNDRIRSALETWQQMGGKGSIPRDSVRHLLSDAKPRVPWERLLRQYAGQALAKEDYSLARPNKRYLSEGLVVPGLYSESMNLVVIALDTSGSMNKEVLSLAIAEIAKLSDLVTEVTLLVGDSNIQEVITTSQLPRYLRELKVKGGGGTDHRPVFKYIDDKHLEPDLFIGLTDLISSFPAKAPRYPVIWIVSRNHEKAPWGRVIEVDEP